MVCHFVQVSVLTINITVQFLLCCSVSRLVTTFFYPVLFVVYIADAVSVSINGL